MLHSLVDNIIKIDRGGPESREGRLIAAGGDYITLLTENEGVVYYRTHHIKSLTSNTKNDSQFDFQVPEDFRFIQAEDFKGVLESLKYHWVQINRGGPEKLEGIVDQVNDNFVTIIAKEEVIRISMFHIRNVSYEVKDRKNKDTNGKKTEDNTKS